jgi:uncharacterized membrane protein YqjE
MQPNGTRDDRPTGELVGDLAAQTSKLVRQELELAKVELAEKGKNAGMGAGMFGGAGVSALYGLGALTAGAILALSQAIDAWLAALIVAVVWFAIAGVLAMMGKSKAQAATPPVPEQAIETTKDDVAVTKARVKEARS